MIFNLVEAAQEFLSQIEPVGKAPESKLLCSSMESSEELFLKEIATPNRSRSFVYGFIDLFSGYEESWNWGFGMDETGGRSSSSIPASKLDGPKQGYEAQENKSVRMADPVTMQKKQRKVH